MKTKTGCGTGCLHEFRRNSIKISVREALKDAVEKGDVERLGNAVYFCRFKLGMTAAEIFDSAHRATGIDRGWWEELMLEADAICGCWGTDRRA